MSKLTPALVKQVRAAGLKVVEIDGWENRGRPASTGGFLPHGVLWHHTGSADANPHSVKDDLDYARWLAITGRSDLPAPLCQLSLGRDGTVYFCAAGRSNHGGKARAAGPMPAGDANTMYVGVEVQNNGTEGWSKTQYEAMVKLAVVLSKYVNCPAGANRAHRETSVTGKWDPGALDMDRFRNDIAHGLAARKAPAMNNVQKARIKLEAMIANGQETRVLLRKAPKGRATVWAVDKALAVQIRALRALLKRLPAK